MSLCTLYDMEIDRTIDQGERCFKFVDDNTGNIGVGTYCIGLDGVVEIN